MLNNQYDDHQQTINPLTTTVAIWVQLWSICNF